MIFSLRLIFLVVVGFLHVSSASADFASLGGKNRYAKSLSSNEIRTWRSMSTQGNDGKKSLEEDSKGRKEIRDKGTLENINRRLRAEPDISTINNKSVEVPTNPVIETSSETPVAMSEKVEEKAEINVTSTTKAPFPNPPEIETELRDANSSAPAPLTIVESFTESTTEAPKEDRIIIPIEVTPQPPMTGLESSSLKPSTEVPKAAELPLNASDILIPVTNATFLNSSAEQIASLNESHTTSTETSTTPEVTPTEPSTISNIEMTTPGTANSTPEAESTSTTIVPNHEQSEESNAVPATISPDLPVSEGPLNQVAPESTPSSSTNSVINEMVNASLENNLSSTASTPTTLNATNVDTSTTENAGSTSTTEGSILNVVSTTAMSPPLDDHVNESISSQTILQPQSTATPLNLTTTEETTTVVNEVLHSSGAHEDASTLEGSITNSTLKASNSSELTDLIPSSKPQSVPSVLPPLDTTESSISNSTAVAESEVSNSTTEIKKLSEANVSSNFEVPPEKSNSSLISNSPQEALVNDQIISTEAETLINKTNEIVSRPSSFSESAVSKPTDAASLNNEPSNSHFQTEGNVSSSNTASNSSDGLLNLISTSPPIFPPSTESATFILTTETTAEPTSSTTESTPTEMSVSESSDSDFKTLSNQSIIVTISPGINNKSLSESSSTKVFDTLNKTSDTEPESLKPFPVTDFITTTPAPMPTHKIVNEEFVKLFDDSEPDNLTISLTPLNQIKNNSFNYENELLEDGTSPGCLYEDRERYQRNILAAVYSMINGEPSALLFSRNSSCVGILSKNGKRSVRSIGSLLPKFPRHLQVEAAAYINDKMYLMDSSPDQNVWTFFYNNITKKYDEIAHLTFSRDAFLQFCDIQKYPKNMYVSAFGQVSINDPTCLVFAKNSPNPLMSRNATHEASSLAHAISYLLGQEFISYVESVFSWLDEPLITSVYVYGSNGELYRIFRDNLPGSEWKRGNYEIMPYSEFPILNKKVMGVF